MADGQFTIRASVQDNASPALKAIQTRIGQLSKSNMTPLERNFREIDKTLMGFTGRLQDTVRIFNSIAIKAAAVSLAFYAIGRATHAIAGSVQDLGILSNRTGLATAQIQGFVLAAQQMRIAPEEASSALSTFSSKVELMRKNINHASEDLLKFGAADFVAQLNNTKEPMDKLVLTFRRMTAISKVNAEYGRMFAKEMFGSEVFARMTEERFLKAIGKFKELTQEQFRSASNYNFAWLNVGATITNLTRQTSLELMPGMTNVLNIIDSLLSRGGDNPQIMKFLKDFNQVLLDIKIEDVVKGLNAFSEAMGRNIKDIKDLIGWIKSLDDTFHINDPRNKGTGTVDRAVRGGFLGLQDWIVGRQERLKRIQRNGGDAQADEMFTPTSFGGAGGGSTGHVQTLALGVKIGMLAAMNEFFNGANDNGGGGMMKAAFNPGSGEGGQRGGTGGRGGGGRWGSKEYPNIGEGSAGGAGGGGGAAATAGNYKMPSGTKAENAKAIYSELRKLGHSHEQAAGALGHVSAESSFNPKVVGDRGTAFGFFQHRGSRWASAQRDASKQGLSPFDPVAAARHFDRELKNEEARAGKRYFGAKTVDEAVTALNGYERFAGWQQGQSGRYAAARKFAQTMQERPSQTAAIGRADKAPIIELPKATPRIDNAIKAQTMSGSIDFNANITAPAGTTAGVRATGDMFRVSRMSRQRQQDEAPRTSVIPWDKAGGWQ